MNFRVLAPEDRYREQLAIAQRSDKTERHLLHVRRLAETSNQLGPDRVRPRVHARYLVALELHARGRLKDARGWALAAGTLELDAGALSYIVQSYVAELWERTDPSVARSFAERALGISPRPVSAVFCRFVLAEVAMRMRDPQQLSVQIDQIEAVLAQNSFGPQTRGEFIRRLNKFRDALAKSDRPPRHAKEA
jgi:hypothetical protein